MSAMMMSGSSGEARRPGASSVSEARTPGLSAFFRYHGPWAPGVRLFRKLSFPAKAAIISVAFLIPLVVLAWSFAQAHAADADFVHAERRGVAYARPLVQLMAAATRERQLARVQARGEAAPDLPKVREQVDALWAKLQSIDQQDRSLLSTAAPFDKARQKWLELRRDAAGSPEQLFAVYSAAIDAQQELLDWAVDHSNLALDPEISSYYVLDATLVAAPDLFHAAGRLRGLLTSAAKEGQIKRSNWLKVEDELQLVSRRTEQVVASIGKARASNAQALSKLVLDDMLSSSKALQQLASTAVDADSVGFDAAEATSKGNALASQALAFIEQGSATLDALLAEREAADKRKFVALMSLSVVCVLLAAYLLKCFYMVTRGGLEEVRSHLVAMTEGDLTTSPNPWGRDEAASLMQSLAHMQKSLRTLVSQVRESADMIVNSSSEMAEASGDLSRRTEHTAANLQQSASSMEEISSTVQQTASNARTAADLAGDNAQVAARGGQVIGQVVETMRGIHVSSNKISDIITVIDGIAFQTNILALNAAVEAARAGEQGRGFAVVASEVRALAQRSATAAREIKALIGESVQRVESGTQVVESAGRTIEEIVGNAQRINTLLVEIAQASAEQAKGVGLVGHAVHDLDQDTQQNSALVEQSAASSQGLRQQAMSLVAAVSSFKLPA
jgi:methyl-accepting chemotaxis protein